MTHAFRLLIRSLIEAYNSKIEFEDFAPNENEIDSMVKIKHHNFPSMRQNDAFLACAGWSFFALTDDAIILYNKL